MSSDSMQIVDALLADRCSQGAAAAIFNYKITYFGDRTHESKPHTISA